MAFVAEINATNFPSLHKDGPEALMLYYCKKGKIGDRGWIIVGLKVFEW